MLRELFDRGKRIFIATRRQQGFTLLELIIVIAIIGVLVAISVPTFTGLIEKSREATDLANVRSAYAEVMIAAIQQDESSTFFDATVNQYKETVDLVQKKDGWDMDASKLNIGGISRSDKAHWKGDAKKGGTCTVIYDNDTGEVTLQWSGYTVKTNWQWHFTSGDKIEIRDSSVDQNSWPASAVPEFISAKYGTGQKVVVDQITEDKYPELAKWIKNGGGYEIGIIMTDTNGNVLADTDGRYIGTNKSDFEITLDMFEKANRRITEDQISKGTDVKIAIQFFKMNSGSVHGNGSTTMSNEEANELSNLFTFEE